MLQGIFRTAVLAGLVSSFALAQTTGSATIVGTVTDNTGAVIPGAKVNVVNTETGFKFDGATNNEGYYYVPYLRPGIYNLSIEFQGFKKHVQNGMQLRTNEQPRIDVKLEVGTVAESVEVQGAAPLLETETTIAGGILEGSTIVKLPVIQKVVFRILAYLPATQVVNGLHIGGQRERAMGYTMDGLGGKEPVAGAVNASNRVVTSSIDAYSEVKAYTTGLPAEFGHSAGGQIAAVFKSGTNEFHGSLEDRYINKKLLHRNYFDQLRPTQPFTYHEISAVLDGPVFIPKIYNGRNKTFWLFGVARHHEKASETFLGDVPSADMLGGNFNFPGVTPNTLYDPSTTRIGAFAGCTGGQTECWGRDPFPNFTIPKSRIDPVITNFLSNNPWTPANRAAGNTDKFGPHLNLADSTTYRSYRTRFDIKIDHQFSNSHKIFGRYSQGHHTSFRDRWVVEAAWRLIDPNAVPFPIDQPNVVISDTYTISPTLINEIRLGSNRRKTTRQPAAADQGWAKKLGIPGVSDESFPEFRGTNQFGLFYRTGPGGKSQEVFEDYTFQDNVTKVAGRHTFKAGYELLRTRYNILTEALPSGRYFMGGTEFPFSPSQSSGNDLANLLLGTVSSAQFQQAQATWLPRWWSHAAYFQDDWKPVRNVTVNLGVRWSYESPYNTKYGQQSQFDPTARDPITGRAGAIVHTSGPLARKDLNNFQPRIGIAWNARPKLVLRANFGMMTQDMFVANLGQQLEEYIATANVQPPPGDPRIAFNLSQGPGNVRFNTNADGSVPFIGTNYSARNASYLDPGIRIPYIMNWSYGMQYELTNNFLIESNYQGTAGVRLLNNWDMNVLPLNVSSDPAQLNAIRIGYQNFRPYPQFGSIQHFSNYGHSTYHGWTTRVERRYKQGLFFNAFFTLSKSINDSEGDGTISGITFYNRRLEKGRANYDVSKRFVAVAIYQLPYGRARKYGSSSGKLKNGLLGGWDLTGSQTIQSGPPMTIGFGGSPNQYLPGASRPNQTPGDPRISGWDIGPNRFSFNNQNRYLNMDAFTYPGSYTAGTLGRNTIEAPGLIWAQISLSKEWKVYERLRFILRWDMNNPYKRNNLAEPDRTYNLGTNTAQNALRGTFARFTGDRGSFGDIGGRLHSFLVLRAEW